MKCSGLRRMLMICMVSAMLVSGTATGVLAVDESVVDGSVVVSTDGGVQGESDVTGDVAEESTDGVEEDGVQEVEDDNLEDIEVSDFSDVSEASDYVEVSDIDDGGSGGLIWKQTKEINEDGTIKVYFRVFLGGNYARSSDSKKTGYLDFSKVGITVLSSDKRTVLKRYAVTDDMFDGEVGNMETSVLTVDMDKWEMGSSFYVHFENLPSIYKSSTQDIRVEYAESDTDFGAGDRHDTFGEPIVYGLDSFYVLWVTPELKDFNTMFYLYDSKGNIGANADLKIEGLNDSGKVIYSRVERTNDDGLILLSIEDNGVRQLRVSSESIVNDEVISGENIYDFSTASVSQRNPAVYIVYTDGNYSDAITEVADSEDGEAISSSIKRLGVNGVFSDANDMMLFKDRDVSVLLYSGRDVVQSFLMSKNDAKKSLVVGGGRYTVKIGGTDYRLGSDSTISVYSDTDIDLVFVPQLSLKVINEKGGKQSNAHFEVVGYSGEFNETSHAFAVNNGGFYSVRNLDTDEVYDVYIGGYRETVLNIADGSVVSSGALDGGTSTSTSASNTDDNVLPPQTGDIFGGVLLSMVGVTGLFGAGYLYYRRKGRKANEKK